MNQPTATGAVSDPPKTRTRPARIIIAKPGLDGHDRGAIVVARALVDAGHEVVYTGIQQTPGQIVAAAVSEDADLIGLSILSGAHMRLFTQTLQLLREEGAADIGLFGGGIIPDPDKKRLLDMGVAAIFGPGTPRQHIVDWVAEFMTTRPDE